MNGRFALLGLFVLSVVPGMAMSDDAAPRPHVVCLLVDDLGWGDVGYHGAEIATPHIDQLAAGGARLEQFYVQPVCSPTRAALMTGRYPMRMGLQVGVIRPWDSHGVPLDERMLPEALREAGYRTAICGKWHLGLTRPEFLPTRRGFDHQYGHYCGAIDYFKHDRDGGHDWHRNDQELHEEGYSTDLIGAEAARLIESQDPRQPLFLYVPFNAVHSPLQAPQSYLDRYAQVEDPKRRIYAAMTTAMDDAVGRIVGAIDARGWRDNTLILVFSDNGGPLNLGATNGRYRAGKGSLYEGGVRVVALANWPGKIAAGSVVNEPLHVVDLYPTLLRLAGASLEQPLAPDGVDVWATIAEGSRSPRSEILHNVTPTGGAVRQGDWKLVRGPGQRGAELFNMADDPFEQHNLAEQHPEIVERLTARLREYRRASVPPKSGGDTRPDNYIVPRVWGQAD